MEKDLKGRSFLALLPMSYSNSSQVCGGYTVREQTRMCCDIFCCKIHAVDPINMPLVTESGKRSGKQLEEPII